MIIHYCFIKAMQQNDIYTLIALLIFQSKSFVKCADIQPFNFLFFS